MTDHNQARTKVKSIDDITSDLEKNNKLDDNKRTRLFVRILINSTKEFLTKKDFDLSQKDTNFLKNQSSEMKKLIPTIVNKLIPGDSIAKKYINKLNEKLKTIENDGEMTELVDGDGTIIGSNIPILQANMHPRKTQDQTVITTRQTNNPVVRGYRVYYGESVEKKEVLDEEDFSEVYGWQEIQEKKVKTHKGCLKVYFDLGIKDKTNASERCKSIGFDPELDETGQQRIFELKKENMIKMIDEIILKKKRGSDDIVKKSNEDHEETPIEKILKRNLESIKRIAEKEDIDINELIKILKVGE